jgi:hypothetical protein
LYAGFTSYNFSDENTEFGTMERENDNRYFITMPPVNSNIMQSLQFKQIRVTSGGSPLQIVQHIKSKSVKNYTLIYGNRREALGDFNNDSVLPK